MTRAQRIAGVGRSFSPSHGEWIDLSTSQLSQRELELLLGGEG